MRCPSSPGQAAASSSTQRSAAMAGDLVAAEGGGGAHPGDNVVDVLVMAAMDQQVPGQGQALELAARSPLAVADRFEVLDMGEAEDAADHLGAGEADGIA